MKLNKRKTFFILFLISIAIAGALAIMILNSQGKLLRVLSNIQISKVAQPDEPLAFRAGEKFIYDVKSGLLRVGKAELIFHGLVDLNGQKLYQITLETKLPQIYDKETIYAETDNFYPVRVERDIKMMGLPAKIIEDYDLTSHSVTIHKNERGKEQIQTIKSDNPLQNIVSLIYLYRKKNNFKPESVLNFNLPTKIIEMKVSNLQDLQVPKGKYKAYLLESIPSQYKVWFDTSENKIPLRIEGTVSFTGARMVLSEIN